jgi:hypothetical protein
LLLSIVLLMVSCVRTDSAVSSGYGVNTDNIAIIERYAQAVEHKNVDSMSTLLSDDYKGYGPSVADSITKAEAVANWKNLMVNLYDSIHYTRSVNIAAKLTDAPHPGDYVSSWSSIRITYKNDKEPVNLFVNVIYRVDNGTITLSRTFYDEADAMRQLGYEFVPPME